MERTTSNLLKNLSNIYKVQTTLAEEALEKNKISESRYNEYLIEGGYGYLVFGDDDDFHNIIFDDVYNDHKDILDKLD